MDAWIVPGHSEVLKQLPVGKYQNIQVNGKPISFQGLPNKHDIVTLNTQGLVKNGYLPIIVSWTSFDNKNTFMSEFFSSKSDA